MDPTGLFNPSAWGMWSQPNQSMVGPKPTMPMAPAAGGAAGQPMPLTPQAGGSANPLSMLLGPLADKFNATPMGQKVESAFDQWSKSHPGGMFGGMAGNPMLAKFGSAMMQGQNPMQSMLSNPGDFAKWMQQRSQQQQGQPPSYTPQPPVPTLQPGMLGGIY